MYRIIIITIMLSSILTSSCSPEGYTFEKISSSSIIDDVVIHTGYSKDANLTELPEEWQGKIIYGSNLIKYDEIDMDISSRTNGREICIKEDESLKAFFVLKYGIQKAKTLLMTAILDYQQVEFTLDGQYGLLHEIHIPSETNGIEITFPIQVDINGNGAHDLQFIFFDDPYNQSLDIDYRSNLHGYSFGYRTVIIAGEDNTPARSIPSSNITGTPIPQEVEFSPYAGFTYIPTDNSHPSERQLYVDETIAGEEYKFQIYLANSDEYNPTRQCTFLFIDYHLAKIDNSDILLINFNPNEEAVLDVTVLLEEPALHQLQMVYLFDPYESVINEEVYTPIVFGSPRIAILAI
jgi:hypothetical protein